MKLSKDAVGKAEAALDKLEPEQITSYEIVKRMYDTIEKTRSRGVSYNKIFEKLTESTGWTIKFSTFRQYVKEAKIELTKQDGQD